MGTLDVIICELVVIMQCALCRIVMRRTGRYLTRVVAALMLLGSITGAAAQANPGGAEKEFIWKVTSPTNTLYLLGSIHFLRASDYPLPAPMQAAFDDAETVVFEVDLSRANAPSTQALVLQKARPDSDREALQAGLSPQTYQLAQAEAAKVGLPITFFHGFEPWFFSTSLTALNLRRLGFQAQHGVDLYFFRRAVHAQKVVLALETLESQLDLLDELPIEVQNNLVQQTIADIDNLSESLTALVSAWSQGDTQTFTALSLKSLEAYPTVYTKLFRDRNQAWLGPIEQYLTQTDDYLVVVGAGHLVGPDGLVQLLSDRGYQVQQL